MLVPAVEQEVLGGLVQVTARSRRSGRSADAQFLLDGSVGIDPLRATSGAVGSVDASVLTEPPSAGYGVLDQLQGQAASTNPLNSGLTPELMGGEGPLPSLGVLQAGLARARQDFARLDGSSRALLAARSPRRTQSGFGVRFLSSTLDIVG